MLDCHGPTFHIVPSFHLVNRQIVADFDIFRAVELCRNSISTGSKLRRKDKTLCGKAMIRSCEVSTRIIKINSNRRVILKK